MGAVHSIREPLVPRVLIVEDDDSQRQTLCDIMHEEGVDPVPCASAAEAIERVEHEEFDVAIVDLRLPDMSGTRVLERLRALNDGIRVIIHTAYADFDSAKNAVNLGAFAYVEKLRDPGELVSQVHRAVAMHSQRALRRSGRPRSITRHSPDYIFQLDWKGTIAPGMERLLQRLIGEHIRLETIQPPGIYPVYAELDQIEQVIMNLVLNARDAMPDGGKLTIEIANVDVRAKDRAKHPGVGPGRYVMIAIGDTGLGMSQDTMESIFDPFFTTHEQATGLGLTEVYGIVARAGGHITVESEPGQGSTFRVYFPAVQRSENRQQNVH
jgi:signal transduction histidine kinase